MSPELLRKIYEMPADRAILFYLADRLRWAAAGYRRVVAICPDDVKPELYTWIEAKNAYYGAKEIYLNHKRRQADGKAS